MPYTQKCSYEEVQDQIAQSVDLRQKFIKIHQVSVNSFQTTGTVPSSLFFKLLRTICLSVFQGTYVVPIQSFQYPQNTGFPFCTKLCSYVDCVDLEFSHTELLPTYTYLYVHFSLYRFHTCTCRTALSNKLYRRQVLQSIIIVILLCLHLMCYQNVPACFIPARKMEHIVIRRR